MFLDSIILIGEAVTNTVTPLENQTNFLALKTNFVILPDWPFLAVFCAMYSVKAQTVPICLIDSQTSL